MAKNQSVEKSKSNTTTENNRIRRLMRTAKKQPNNKQIEEALKTTGMPRKAPTTPVWSHSWIAVAKLFKQFAGKFDKDIMSSNPTTAMAALAKHSEHPSSVQAVSGKVDFSLGARAHDKYGNKV